MKHADTQTTTLFLHMGPGFNSYVERQILGPIYPFIDYWDQPIIAEPKDAFGQLLKHIEEKVDDMYKKLGEPIEIWAHSFGAYPALKLLKKTSSKIKKLKVFNSSFDIIDGYLNLLEVIKTRTSNIDLKNKITAFLKSDPKKLKIENLISNIITYVASEEMYIKHYFYLEEDFKRYVEIVAKATPLDINTFQHVLTNYVSHHFSPTDIYPESQKVEIILGTDDPFHTRHCEEYWKKALPQARLIIKKDIGHFSHLEGLL